MLADLIEAENRDGGDGFQDEDDGDPFGNFDRDNEEYMSRRERERSATVAIVYDMDDGSDVPTPNRETATSVGPYSRHL